MEPVIFMLIIFQWHFIAVSLKNNLLNIFILLTPDNFFAIITHLSSHQIQQPLRKYSSSPLNSTFQQHKPPVVADAFLHTSLCLDGFYQLTFLPWTSRQTLD